MSDQATIKCCSRCRIEKRESKEFFHFVAQRQAFASICKACRNAQIQVRQSKPEVIAARLASERARYAAQPEKFRAKNKAQYDLAREQRIAKGKLDSRIRARLNNYLRGGKGSRSWREKVGYSLDELKTHIERCFLSGMGWHNSHLWHVEHIIPLSAFEYANVDEKNFKIAWALTNLRPMWAKDNVSKGASRTLLL